MATGCQYKMQQVKTSEKPLLNHDMILIIPNKDFLALSYIPANLT
jgi:hypothetical protein